jgi:hypothetical protein
MKKSLVLAGVFALATTSAFAGGFSQPIVEPMIQEPMMPAEVVEQKSSSSSAGIVIPIIVVVALLLAAKNSGKL